jgi:branched-chain amino acid aminotransferase
MPPYAFFHKQFMPLADAKIGILTHALHYGTACFEGIRGNWDSDNRRFCLFRIQDHYRRMLDGARLLKMNVPYSVDELCQLTVETVKRSGYRENVYIRPVVYKSSETIGVRLHNLEDDFFIIVTTLPPYLGAEKGVRCRTSSWCRINDTMVPRGKISGAYVNGALAKTEACEGGFDEAILLTHDGYVAEGSGENIFLASKGNLITPDCLSNILVGITRDTVIRLAKDELGIETIERRVSRSELYLADECFFTGTAANIAPIVEIDYRPVNKGEIGKITTELQKIFAPVILGRNPKYPDWYTLVSG